MSRYLIVLLLSGVPPFLLSFYGPLAFWRHARALGATLSFVVVVFGAWDVVATARGHWHFDPAGVYPARLINLPLEEVLFFVVIPFCCIFTWEVCLYYSARKRP
jgi:lycopene cyclase domain-containing protein